MALRRERFHVFVNEHFNFTDGQGLRLRQAGCSGLIFKGHSGSEGTDGHGTPDVGHPDRDKLIRLKAMGFEIGCFGAFGPKDNPVKAAQAANGAIQAFGYTFYVANIEIPYNDRAFLTEFRRLRPSFTVWLSCEISNQRDWAAWFKKGEIIPNYPVATAWQPQCYMNIAGKENETPSEAEFWATRKNTLPPNVNGGAPRYIPADQCVATIGLWDADGRRDVNRDIEELDKVDHPGFSVWRGETMTPAEIGRLAWAIDTKQIALK